MSKSTTECTSCQNIQKKLKILQADYDFEIKKLNEDKSSEKVLYELSMNRQIKKLQDKCQKEKQERIKQNECWMQKYDELMAKQKLQMTQYKEQKDQEAQLFKKAKQTEMEKFKVQIVSSLQTTIHTLKEQKETLRAELASKYEVKIKEMNIQQDQKVAKLTQKHEEEIKKKCSQYEATILGIQSEKTVEENLHRKTKQQSRQSQARLNQAIYSLKKSIFEHQEKISSLKTQIQDKCEKVEFLHGQIVRKQTEQVEKYEQLSRYYDNKYEAHKQSTEKRLEQLFKRQLDNCSKYQKALQKIQEHREMQNQMYKANLNEIKSCVDERPSRFEDVDQIITLKEKLLKKQRQCQTLSEELKWFRLQLQNKEETYNRIFGPDSKNNQSIYIRRKDLKMKRTGKSVTTVRQILGTVNSGNNLAPLVGNMEKKLLPPKQNRIL